MRFAALLLIPVLLLAGCSREPDFDERYDAASSKIGTTAREIDAEIERRQKAADPDAEEPAPEGPASQDTGKPRDDAA